jgi:hypothetical protein
LPWTSVPELVLVLAASAAASSGMARRTLREWLPRMPRPLALGVVALPLAAIALKLVSLQFQPFGFAACYATLVPEHATGRCERSFDAAFAPASVTRYDATIDFFPRSWQHGFVNSSRFNFYRRGQLVRDRLPFTATWIGTIDLGSDTELEIQYIGQADLFIGAESVELPAGYDRDYIDTLIVPAGRHRLFARYRYEADSRVGEPRRGGPPGFHVRIRQPDGSTEPLAPWRGAPAAVGMSALVGLVLSLGALISLAALPAAARDLLIAALCAVGGGIASGLNGLSRDGAFIVLLVAAAAAVMFPACRRNGVLLPVALAAAALLAIYERFSIPFMIIRSGGDDWLTYESFARSILETRSLEGGEAVFYYQPFYRYVRFLMRILLGEGDFLVYAATNFALYGLILTFTALAAARVGAWVRCAVVLPASCSMLALVNAWGALRATEQGLAEPVAWALFLAAILTFFFARPGGSRDGASLWGAALAGLSAITRLNHLPAVLLMGAMFVLGGPSSRRRRTALLVAAGLAAVLVLPLIHNLRYGGVWVVTTRSAAIPANLVLSPSLLRQLQSEARVRERFANQLRHVFDVGLGEEDRVLLFGVRVAQGSWLVAIAVALRRRTLYLASVALLPLAYLGVHVFYQVEVYYPRHIIAGHLAMAVSGCLAFLNVQDRARRAVGASAWIAG